MILTVLLRKIHEPCQNKPDKGLDILSAGLGFFEGRKDQDTWVCLYCSQENTRPLRFEFEGRAIGAFILAGPDAAKISYGIDNEAEQEIDLYHHYSKNLHYPRTIIFARLKPVNIPELEPIIAGNHNAVRIMEFCINKSTMEIIHSYSFQGIPYGKT